MPSYRFSDGQAIRWTGLSACLCASCRDVFSSASAFDKHRRDSACVDPASLGMVRNERGYWVSRLMTEAEKSRVKAKRDAGSSPPA